MNPLFVLSNVPDAATADQIARALIEARAAACVNVLAPARSMYRWRGAIEEAVEIPLAIKTTADAYARVEEIIRALHPYEVPEIIALPIAQGLPAYLAWLATESEHHE